MNKLVKMMLLPGEVQALLNVWGQAPASMGTWPLMLNVKEQAEVQLAARKPEDRDQPVKIEIEPQAVQATLDMMGNSLITKLQAALPPPPKKTAGKRGQGNGT